MAREELKAIEVLTRSIANGTNLEDEISSEYRSTEKFNHDKASLFNLMVIYELLDTPLNDLPFSLDIFLKTGRIIGLFDEETFVPSMDPRYNYSFKEFFDLMFEALRNGNYVFDEGNNIYISTKKLETTIPSDWLYRLMMAVRKNVYKHIFFYNKNKENDINDKNDLLDYLYHTKTFYVEMTTVDPNISMDDEFARIREEVLEETKGKGKISVDDVMALFMSKVPYIISVNLSKYKIDDLYYIIAQAETRGKDFYSKDLVKQQEMIDSWMLDYIRCNEISLDEAKKMCLMSSKNSLVDEVNEKKALLGFVNLFFRILDDAKVNGEDISLIDFDISEYVSSELREHLVSLRKTIKEINRCLKQRGVIGKNADALLVRLSNLDQIKDKNEISDIKTNHLKLINAYHRLDDVYNVLSKERNSLQDLVKAEKENSTIDLAFDNDSILNLLIDVCRRGRIYVKPGTSKVVFEQFDRELGKVVFKASINLDDLILFMENVNFYLNQGYGEPKR